MLTFYPEFEAESIYENEIVLLLDLSHSMNVSCNSTLPLLLHLSIAFETFLPTLLCVAYVLCMLHVFLQGIALRNAKKVALLLLQNLPQNTLFNIFTFGSGLWKVATTCGNPSNCLNVWLQCLTPSSLQVLLWTIRRWKPLNSL